MSAVVAPAEQVASDVADHREARRRCTPARVVQVTAHYPPYVGGVENAVAALATELARTREVEVLTSDIAAHGAARRETRDGVRVRRYRAWRIGNTPVFPGLVVGLLRQPAGTVVHVHGPHAFLGELSRVICRARGLSLVLHVHLEVGRSTMWGVFLPAYRTLVTGPTLRAADRVFALTPDMAQRLQQRYRIRPERVVVVPNALSAPPPGALYDGGQAPPDPNRGSTLRVLSLGRLVPQKRISRLLEAVTLCDERVEVVIVGDGELRPELEAQAAVGGADIRFTGSVDREGVAGWLAWADVFVLTSEREGMPLSVLEAMAAGVPVLAADVEGSRELVRGHGLLVEESAVALAQGLDRLARDPALREQLATSGRQRARRDSWHGVADDVARQYAQITPTGRRRAMDPTDAAWASIQYTRTLWGLGPLDVERVRTALAMVLARSPWLARSLDTDDFTCRPLTRAERWTAPAEMVLAGAAYATPEEADAAAMLLPLGDRSFRLLVGPGYLAAHCTHAFGDEWTAITVLTHLVEQSRADVPLDLPWTEVSSRRRRLLTARQLAGRPRTVLRALLRRGELSGGAFEPAARNVLQQTNVCTRIASPEGFLSRVRDERMQRGLHVSLAAVTLTGLRHAITTHLAPPVPGAEVVYDVRRESVLTGSAIGNWVAGVFVVPDDDGDVTSVSRAMGAVREDGLILVAAAATRRATRRVPTTERMVFAADAGLRLTLSYIPGHGPLAAVPFVDPGHAYFGVNPPNGVNTITLVCAEVGGRMHLAIQHYEATWSSDLIRRAAEDFFADPWGDARTGTGTGTGTRGHR